MNCPKCKSVAMGTVTRPFDMLVLHKCPKCGLTGTEEQIKMTRSLNPTYDPTMDRIPPEVMAAEQTIAEFMKDSETWELGRLCSRNHAEKLRTITRTLLDQ